MTNDAASDVYHRPMHRGEFLKHSLLLMVVSTSCLLRPGGRALAAGRARSSKPPLTEAGLGLARHLMQKETHLPQGVWSTGDEKERLGTSGFPAAHLVQAYGTGADHVVSVGIFTGALGRLHDPDTSGPWDEARAAKARQFFFVLGDKQRHGGDSIGEGGRVFAFLREEGVEALDVLGELFRGLMSRARGAQPAISEARDAAQASIAAPATYPDRQARLLHGFWF